MLPDPLSILAQNHGPAVLYLRSAAGDWVWVSPQSQILLGCAADQLTGRAIADQLAAGPLNRQRWLDHLEATVAGQFDRHVELEMLAPSGTTRWVELRERPVPPSLAPQPGLIAGTLVDTTVQRLEETRALHTQRLENLGLLAAGIAHDLNNILAPILISSSLLRPLATDERQQRMVEILETSAERGARIVRQILSFAHGDDADRGPIDPRHILRELSMVMEETFPRTIRLTENIPRELGIVHANPTQLHQLLLNLCVNARDAMPDGGTLTLVASRVRLPEPGSIASLTPSWQEWVRIQVKDTGGGIAPADLEQIWQPFYTTKPKGKGTGLGLSTTRNLVIAHGGFIEVESHLHRGTTFTVHLPIEVYGEEPGVRELTEVDPHPGHGEKILIVDDEPSVRDVIRETLVPRGYQVILASDGVEALAAINLSTDGLALVITDVHMPHMTGDILVNVLKRMRQDLPVLAISGHPDAPGKWDAPNQARPDAILAKPFTGRILLQSVRALLDQPRPPRSAS